MTPFEAVLLGLLVILVLASAFLALAEVALLRVQPVTLAAEASPDDRGARRVLALLDELPLVVNTVLLVVLFNQVSAAAVSGYLAQAWVGGIGVTVITVVVTLVLFIYAEVIPKTLALRAPLRWARFVARPVALLVRLLRPVTKALLFVADAHMPASAIDARTAFTETELRKLTAESARAGEIEPEDAELVEKSFDFGDLTVADVRVGRDDVIAARVSMTVDEALALAIEHGHRRLPVCGDRLDDIVGLVRLRDLAAATSEGAPQRVADLVLDTLVVAPHDAVAEVLRRMQASDHRFAVVVDAAGTVDGILTVEDIVAELVGEIEEAD